MFVYQAQSLAIGGSIRRPVAQLIDVPAASSLPSVGGQQTNRMGRFEIPGVLYFASAFTQVSGSFDAKENAYNTQGKAVVEGFNLQDIVTCDRIVAQFSSKFAVGAAEPEMRPLGAQFNNLKINGRPVDIALQIDLHATYPTYSGLRAQYQADASLREKLNKVNLWKKDPATLPEQLRHYAFGRRGVTDYPENGMIFSSLLQDPLEIPGATSIGPMVHIPGFGRVYIAEYVMWKKSRRLTMLRFQLGSPLEGDISIPEMEGNGSPPDANP